MKLTQGIRDKIIEAYCTKKYHAVINTLNMEFENAVTEAVKKLFSKFDFEKAKEFEKVHRLLRRCIYQFFLR